MQKLLVAVIALLIGIPLFIASFSVLMVIVFSFPWEMLIIVVIAVVFVLLKIKRT